MKSNSLNNAKSAKNDEFYTKFSDIENELQHYSVHFKGKVVYCNCDDYKVSNFFKYFFLNFSTLGLKRLICTGYKEGGHGVKYITDVGDANGNGEVDLNELETIELEGDGSYCSPECLDLLNESDIVVSNPPFSLFRSYVNTLIEYNKKFLIIGNMNAIPCKDIFKLIKEHKIWFGYNHVNGFIQPDGTEKKFGNILWYTNLDHDKLHNKISFEKSYDPKEYPHYENHDAIEVSRAVNIPKDYSGVMGVPISFLDKLNPDQFEVIDCDDPRIDLEYFKTFSCFPGEYKSRQVRVDGKVCQKVYHRIFIKRK